MRKFFIGLLVLSSFSLFAAQASAAQSTFTPVSGSPFGTGTATTPRSIAFSPNGAFAAIAATGTNSVSVFSVASNGGLSQVAQHAAGTSPQSVAFSPSGNLLAVASSGAGNDVTVFSVASNGGLSQVVQQPAGSSPQSVAFSPSGNLLAVASSTSNNVTVFSVASNGGLSQVVQQAAGSSPQSVAFSPSGNLLATANSGTSNVSVFMLAGPTATISSPASGGAYALGQAVPTSFSCADSTYGPGIASCKDSGGASSPAGHVNTAIPGTGTYTVTATSKDGETYTTSITYTVVDCSTMYRTGFNDGFNDGFNPGFNAVFRAAYRPHGAWSAGFTRGYEAARFGGAGGRFAVRQARVKIARATKPAAANDPKSATPQQTACSPVFNSAFNQGFDRAFNAAFKAAWKQAFNDGFRQGFARGSRS